VAQVTVGSHITRGFSVLICKAVMSKINDTNRFETIVSAVLRNGMSVATASLVIGLLFWMFGLFNVVSAGLLHAGLIIVVGMPTLRALLAFSRFLRTGEWSFVAITAGVFAMLVTSLVLAF